jgi:hypothetical protein
MAELPKPTTAKLPRWRGFNLLEKFSKDWSDQPFVERDFAWIAEWGFDFVRLPVDYRTYVGTSGWLAFDEASLRTFDAAIAYGRRYGVHVNLNLHRAPGYCVNPPQEPTSLWTDAEALDACAAHWAMWARRYRGIPNEQLSFDLLNEPAGVPNPVYARVVRALVEAIRKEDPARLVIADGNRWGNEPVPELVGLGVAQSTRGYAPMWLSHFQASWIGGSDAWPTPTWPRWRPMPSFLYGPGKPRFSFPLVLQAEFPAGTEITLRVHRVFQEAHVQIQADGETILEQSLVGGSGAGDVEIADLDLTASLPKAARRLRIGLTAGEWLEFSLLRVSPWPGAEGGAAVLAPGDREWGTPQQTYALQPDGRATPVGVKPEFDAERLWREQIEPWQALERQGVGVHVGEWGVFNRTPHAVALRWMEDCLANWRKAGWGWALWNFRGPFGVLDSGRADVRYEEFKGAKLDRAMLEVLRNG